MGEFEFLLSSRRASFRDHEAGEMRINPVVDIFAFLTGPSYGEPVFMTILYWIVALATLAVAITAVAQAPRPGELLSYWPLHRALHRRQHVVAAGLVEISDGPRRAAILDRADGQACRFLVPPGFRTGCDLAAFHDRSASASS